MNSLIIDELIKNLLLCWHCLLSKNEVWTHSCYYSTLFHTTGLQHAAGKEETCPPLLSLLKEKLISLNRLSLT